MKRLFAPLALKLLLAVSGIMFANISQAQSLTGSIEKFSDALNYIDRYYVDTVNDSKLVEEAIVKMLEGLDPHSNYLTPEEVKEMNEPLQGNFEGIGVSFNILNDTILVINPVPGGPSEKLGILAGDKIVRINGENVAGIGINNKGVFDRLRGAKGTVVNVGIMRNRESKMLEFSITRDKIPIFSLDAAYILADGVGYIKLNRFAQTTTQEFLDALRKLKSQKITSLVLDLSGNGGGYLDEAIKLSDQFLENNKVILYTQGVNSPRSEYRSSKVGEFESGKLVVIIDEGSASASEIVSGALQDWDRAVIVGRRSYGKGLVQRPFPLPDGSMLRLTVARYYTPTGRLIQKSYDHGLKAYEEELITRYNHGEFVTSDSIHFPDSLKYFTLEKHHAVYGGGGIMPDLFVPIDTSAYSDYYRDIVRKGILNRFILAWVDVHRADMKQQYPAFKLYRDKFVVTDAIFNELVAFAEKEKLPRVDKDIAVSREQIALLIKAYIARDLWDTSEFYEIYNTSENSVLRALDVLKNWDKFTN